MTPRANRAWNKQPLSVVYFWLFYWKHNKNMLLHSTIFQRLNIPVSVQPQVIILLLINEILWPQLTRALACSLIASEKSSLCNTLLGEWEKGVFQTLQFLKTHNGIENKQQERTLQRDLEKVWVPNTIQFFWKNLYLTGILRNLIWNSYLGLRLEKSMNIEVDVSRVRTMKVKEGDF